MQMTFLKFLDPTRSVLRGCECVGLYACLAAITPAEPSRNEAVTVVGLQVTLYTCQILT